MNRLSTIWTLLILIGTHLTFAQAPITALTSSYVSVSSPVGPYTTTPAPNSGSFSTCSSTSYMHVYSSGASNALKLTGFTAAGKNFFVASTVNYIRLQRVDNASVTGKRSIVFFESATAPSANCPASGTIALKSPYQDAMENFLDNIYINQGTDNIFTNGGNGDGNNNNIERVDVIFSAGIGSNAITDVGFALFERGTVNNHDAFRIAAVTSLDASGNPASFGPVKTCIGGNGTTNGNWGHPTLANGNKDLSVFVLRKEEAETRLRVSSAVNQQLGAVFFSLADLGVTAGQKIYGYSLIAGDGLANPTSAQLLNLSDATVYPTNTTEGVGGGLDLVAVNALFTDGAPVLASISADLSLSPQANASLLSWKAGGLIAGTRTELQKSLDSTAFFTLYQQLASAEAGEGSYMDQLSRSSSWYRLKLTFPDGRVIYSRTVRQLVGADLLLLYPNRAARGQSVTVLGLKANAASVLVAGIDGRSQRLPLFVHAQSGTLNLTSFSMRGCLIIQFVGFDGKPLGQAKLIVAE
jgi:hypothetical protein